MAPHFTLNQVKVEVERELVVSVVLLAPLREGTARFHLPEHAAHARRYAFSVRFPVIDG